MRRLIATGLGLNAGLILVLVYASTARTSAGSAGGPDAATTQSFSPTTLVTKRLSADDTYIDLNATNYSSASTLRVFTWPNKQRANAILLKFDLSSLPAGTVVITAKLSLAMTDSDAMNDVYRVSAHRMRSNMTPSGATGYTRDGATGWSPSTCCYNGIPLAQADISDPIDTLVLDRSPGFKTWTITNLVKNWIESPATNFGVMLNADTTTPKDRFRTFASNDHADANLRPVLEIIYSTPDPTPPTVAITAPPAGAALKGAATLAANASDNVGVAGVRFEVDGNPVGAEITASPFSVTWDTTAATDGPHVITAVARDAAGNLATSSAVNVSVQNGVMVLAPQDTYLNLDANTHGAEATVNVYTWPDYQAANAILMKFNLTNVPAGKSIARATLHLALVNADGQSAAYNVSVHKVIGHMPTIAAATGLTADGVNAWNANACCHNGVPLAQADISGGYETKAVDRTAGYKGWNVTAMAQDWLRDPSQNKGLLLNADSAATRDRHRFFASVDHPDPSLRPYLKLEFGGGGLAGDTTPPNAAVTSPATNETVSGTVTLSATASDNVGVAGVQFRVDGANVGAEDTTAPYSAMWNSTVASNSTHTISAVARDTSGNTAASSGVVVTASNPIADTTAPSVSITSPVAAATVSGSVALIASATDNVGVTGVQFKVDGANVGSEDTTSPYQFSWISTTVSNGSHSITATARDAAGNTGTGSAVVVTVSNTTVPPVVFDSNWDITAGHSTTAITDGGRWSQYDEFNGGSSVQLLSVVNGGPNGHNALRVQQRGSAYAANLQKSNLMPPSTDYYVRYYFKTDDTSFAGDHIVTPDIYMYENLTYLRKYGGANSWKMVMSVFGCGYTYPIGYWQPAINLSNGQWYRMEYFVHFVDATHIQVHPRVYDASGNLLFSDAQFRQSDFGQASWNGRGDWTLASYYAAGHSFCVQPEYLRTFGVGNNGQQSATDTGLFWYFAGVQIRTDTWPGPLQ